MSERMLTCRVCGTAYKACRSIKPGSNMFNWREVACSPECGTIYFDRIMASRAKTHEDKTEHNEPADNEQYISESIEDDEDDEFIEDDEDMTW